MARIKEDELNPEDTFSIPSTVAIDKLIQRKLKFIGLDDYADISSHNVRKTFINYMIHMGVDRFMLAEIVGHDVRTMQEHYAKSTLMNRQDKVLIRKIVGNLPERLKGEVD
jgi:integrase